MVLFLFLLESEVFLILFGVELFLLLLVFLVQPRTPRVRNRQPLVRWTIVGMNTRAANIRVRIGRRLIATSRFASWDRTAIPELSGPASGRHRWSAMIHGGAQLSVVVSLFHVPCLCGHRCHVSLTSKLLFLPRRASVDASIAAVVAGPLDRCIVIDDRGVVGVMDLRDVYAVHPSVVVKAVTVPAASFKPVAKIAITIVHAAVETHERAPVTFMKDISAFAPTPPTWRP